jgi:hypothetical protein
MLTVNWPLPEKQVSLDACKVEPGEGMVAVERFNEFFKLKPTTEGGNPKDLPALIEKIKMSVIETLYAQARDHETTNEFITALRITLAADGTKVKAIYSALQLNCVETYYDVCANPISKYTVGWEGTKYEIQNDTLVQATITDPPKSYSDNIHVSEMGNGSYRNAQYGNTITHDVQSHILTFQEIFKLAKDNHPMSNVHLYNALRQVNELAKHGVLLTPVTLINVTSGGTTAINELMPTEAANGLKTIAGTKAFNLVNVSSKPGGFANMSHLCPPSCSGFLFIME